MPDLATGEMLTMARKLRESQFHNVKDSISTFQLLVEIFK